MGNDNTFEYAEKITVKELADYFLKLADGFKCRSLELHGSGQDIALAPEEHVKLEIKAKNKEDEGEFELEVFWKKEPTANEEKLEVTPGTTGDSGTP